MALCYTKQRGVPIPHRALCYTRGRAIPDRALLYTTGRCIPQKPLRYRRSHFAIPQEIGARWVVMSVVVPNGNSASLYAFSGIAMTGIITGTIDRRATEISDKRCRDSASDRALICRFQSRAQVTLAVTENAQTPAASRAQERLPRANGLDCVYMLRPTTLVPDSLVRCLARAVHLPRSPRREPRRGTKTSHFPPKTCYSKKLPRFTKDSVVGSH